MSKKNLEIRDRTIFDGLFVKYILKLCFKVWFKMTGWQAINSGHKGAGITIAAPHTSNWDIIYAMGAAILLDIKIYFSIKESWCRVPLIGSVMMWMGAIPISRESGSQGQVEKIKRFVNNHKNSHVFFLFTPEGTRGAVNQWKTGFYHLAKNTDLPIFLAKVDFLNKESGVFHTYHLTGDKQEDIRSIQESYKKVRGKFPAKQFPKYSGPLPDLSDCESMILKAVYSAKGMATRLEIAAKLKANKLSTAMLDFLIEKGVLEKIIDNAPEPQYKLTFAGKGCLLHLYPNL